MTEIIRFGTLEALLAELGDGVTVRTQALSTRQTDSMGMTHTIIRRHVTASIGQAIGLWTFRTGIIEEINGTNWGRHDRATGAAANERIGNAVIALLTERGLQVKSNSLHHVPDDALTVEGNTNLLDLRGYYPQESK